MNKRLDEMGIDLGEHLITPKKYYNYNFNGYSLPVRTPKKV
jgi:hypothetical protein